MRHLITLISFALIAVLFAFRGIFALIGLGFNWLKDQKPSHEEVILSIREGGSLVKEVSKTGKEIWAELTAQSNDTNNS